MQASNPQYQVFKPTFAIRHWVKYYWSLSDLMGNTNDGLPGPPRYDLVIPDGSTELIFNWGSAYERKGLGSTDQEIMRRSCMVGQRNQSVLARRLEPTQLIGVKFKPGALSQLLGIPEVHFKNQVVAISDLNLPGFDRLEAALYECKDIQLCLQKLDQFFMSALLMQGTNTGQLNPILRCIQDNHMIDLQTLQQQFEIHPKKLQRLFNQHVGLSPKNYLRVMRFKNLYKQINRQAMAFYDQSVFDWGYYDQMHFIKEFKSFIGQSPSDYYQGKGAVSDKILTDTLGQLKKAV